MRSLPFPRGAKGLGEAVGAFLRANAARSTLLPPTQAIPCHPLPRCMDQWSSLPPQVLLKLLPWALAQLQTPATTTCAAAQAWNCLTGDLSLCCRPKPGNHPGSWPMPSGTCSTQCLPPRPPTLAHLPNPDRRVQQTVGQSQLPTTSPGSSLGL